MAGTSKRVCLLDGKAVAPTTSVPEAQKAKQANKKKLQKHDGSLLETKIDTVLNAPGRVQAQIDSLNYKQAALNPSTKLENKNANLLLQNPF